MEQTEEAEARADKKMEPVGNPGEGVREGRGNDVVDDDCLEDCDSRESLAWNSVGWSRVGSEVRKGRAGVERQVVQSQDQWMVLVFSYGGSGSGTGVGLIS